MTEANYNFPVGARVPIICRSFGGEFVLEGYATIKKIVDDCEAVVKFDGDRRHVRRFVDPMARDPEFLNNPQPHIDSLNKNARAA